LTPTPIATASHRLQVGVGRGQHPHVDRPRARGSDPADLALLQDAQQAKLHARRHLAHLVEEDGPSVGLLEQALALGGRAGEGPAGMAEQLGLQERLRQGPAVLGHELGGSPRPVVVDQTGEELLAGARLAQQEHRGVGVEDLPGQVHRFAEPGRSADQPFEGQGRHEALGGLAPERVHRELELVAEARVVPGQRVALDRPPHDEQQFVRVPRLRTSGRCDRC
jgi:hypothetical protein